MDKCPNCREECNYQTEFKCFNCGEHFWQSQEAFTRNVLRNQRDKEKNDVSRREAEKHGEVHKINSYESYPSNKSYSGISGKVIGIGVLVLIFTVGFLEDNAGSEFLNSCERTLGYSIGEIDARFGISTSQVVDLIAEVEQIWELPTGFDMFEYDPTASFSVDFIFDERQEKTNKAKEIDLTLSDLVESLDGLDADSSSLIASYDDRFALFETRLNSYNYRMDQLNADIVYWNSLGGAPDDVYNRLTQEEYYLELEMGELDWEQSQLDGLENEITGLVASSNSLVDDYNQNVNSYNEIYGNGSEFDQGAYFGGYIEIYQFEDLIDLKLILAHEFGHALDLDHVTNPKSIMYYLMEEQNVSNIALSAEDIAALNTQCS